MSPLLEVRELSQSHGSTPVFSRVGFAILPGEHLALLGPSGCGKSTLLRLLAGLDAPAEGQIKIEDRLVSAPGKILVPPHERGIAMVFQDLALWPNLDAIHNVLLGMAQTPLSRSQRGAQALAALKLCGVEAFTHRKPAQLSAGQQQRVALARALAVRPKLLLLDEPFSGLDVILKAQLLAEIQDLAREHGVTLMLVTHDPLEATALCRNALVIEEGAACEHGTFRDLLRKPASATLRAFLRQLPQTFTGASGGVTARE
ncbi:MAG: ABC transporter ATP-binding protein [Chthoniobacteraceae bacterium]